MLSVLTGWGGAARDARASVELAPIRIDVESCPAPWDPEIRLALAVELGDERLAGARTDPPPAVPGSRDIDVRGGHRVSVHCDERRVQVLARDSRSAATLERTLAGDLPAATAPRLVALVAVELLTALDAARRRRPQASARASQAAGPPSAASPSTWDHRRLSLTAGGVYRTFLSPGGVHAWGGVLDARRASPGGRWSVGLGVEIAGAERTTSAGQASALLASAHASAGRRVRLADDRLALSLDLGGRAGAVRLSGRSDDPNLVGSTVFRPWAGPVATLRAQVGLSWLCAEIAAEAGWAAVSADGLVDHGPALAASGTWVAISLGAGGRR